MTDWAETRPPSLDDIEALARDTFAQLPESFRRLCEGLIIQVADFADDETLDGDGRRNRIRPARPVSRKRASRKPKPRRKPARFPT